MSNHIAQSRPIGLKEVAGLVLAVTLAISAIAATPGFVSHRSPEFTISEPSGSNILLSALRGKVVVMEFFFLQSDHCMRVAKMLNKLNVELGPRGFQALGIVFDPPNAPDTRGQLVGPAVEFFKLTYPIGYSNKADIDRYLDRKRGEVLNIPQIVVIDRTGIIRAASGAAGGDRSLEDEASLRELIQALLKKPATN